MITRIIFHHLNHSIWGRCEKKLENSLIFSRFSTKKFGAWSGN